MYSMRLIISYFVVHQILTIMMVAWLPTDLLYVYACQCFISNHMHLDMHFVVRIPQWDRHQIWASLCLMYLGTNATLPNRFVTCLKADMCVCWFISVDRICSSASSLTKNGRWNSNLYSWAWWICLHGFLWRLTYLAEVLIVDYRNMTW